MWVVVCCSITGVAYDRHPIRSTVKIGFVCVFLFQSVYEGGQSEKKDMEEEKRMNE